MECDTVRKRSGIDHNFRMSTRWISGEAGESIIGGSTMYYPEVHYPREFLNCGICNNKYNDPVQLPCFHSYCGQCITQNENGTYTCPMCTLEGPSQSDQLITSILESTEDGCSFPVCREHNGVDRDLFCRTCKVVICHKCRDDYHQNCEVDELASCDSVINNFHRELMKTLDDEMTTVHRHVNNVYENNREKHLRQQKEKCRISTDISTLFHNIKNKLLEHLREKERVMLHKLNQHYVAEEQNILKEMKIAKSAKERIENEQDVIQSLQSAQASLSTLCILDSVKRDISIYQSKVESAADVKSAELLLRLGEINKVFELKPADLNTFGLQDLSDDHVSDVPRVTLEELLTYKNTTTSPLGERFGSLSRGNSDGRLNVRNGSRENLQSRNRNSLYNLNEGFALGDSGTNDSQSIQLPSTPTQPRPNIQIQPSLNTNSEILASTIRGGPTTQHESTSRGFPCEPESTSLAYNIADSTLAQDFTHQFYKHGIRSSRFKNQYCNESQTGSWIGLTWIDNSRILMVDRWNNKLKIVTPNGVLVSARAVPGGEPCDIAYIRNQNSQQLVCAVTVPQKMKILFVRVSGKIEIFKEINTRCGYSSIAHDRNGHSLVCGCSLTEYHPPAVHIIDVNGIVRREFVLDSFGILLFEYPGSIDVTEDGQIIVCDWQKRRLVFLRRDGLILGIYDGQPTNPLVRPVGTALDDIGNVLVADSATNAVHVVSIDQRRFVASLSLDVVINAPREINFIGTPQPKIIITSGADVNVFDLFRS